MGIIKEFKAFALKGSVVDLAVGVVIGAAFGKIVSSLVADIMMPLLNPLIPGGNWREIVIGPGVKIGSFLAATVDFVIVAFIIFLVIKGINRFRGQEKPAGPTKQEELLAEIRDLLKAQGKN